MKKLLTVLVISLVGLTSCSKYSKSYSIGQELNGGIIIKLNSNGTHGVIASKEDQVTMFEYHYYEESLTIIDNYGSGWRMPNEDELNTMYSMRSSIGGFKPWYYWSNKYVNGKRTAIHFGNGTVTEFCGGGSHLCSRAVKDF